MGKRSHFIEGGGTIPWLRLVSPGRTDPSEPSWGGWSGRYASEKVLNVPSPYPDVSAQESKSKPFPAYTDFSGVKDHWIDPQDGKIYDDQYAPIWPWRVAIWNDFKARMDWCVQPYAQANHHPVVAVDGDSSNAIVKINVINEKRIYEKSACGVDVDRASDLCFDVKRRRALANVSRTGRERSRSKPARGQGTRRSTQSGLASRTPRGRLVIADH